ncbi:hypothetical protein HDU76_008779 [Blyttiomyces sp. JEL0837]|nr:hypothetical protein HDU76_008779 [Blyttiomyces sp. JEL0837]
MVDSIPSRASRPNIDLLSAAVLQTISRIEKSAEAHPSNHTIDSYVERSSISSNIENGAESASVAETTTVVSIAEETPAIDKKAGRKAAKKENKERNRANRAGATIVAEGMSAAEQVSSPKTVSNGPATVDLTMNIVNDDAVNVNSPFLKIKQQDNSARNSETAFVEDRLTSHDVPAPIGQSSSTNGERDVCWGNTELPSITPETGRVDKKALRKATKKVNKDRKSRAGIIGEGVHAAGKVSSSTEMRQQGAVIVNDTVVVATQILHDEVYNKVTDRDIPASENHDAEPESIVNDIIAGNEHINDQYINSAVFSGVDVTVTGQVNMSREEGFDATASPEHDSSSKTDDELKTGDPIDVQIESIKRHGEPQSELSSVQTDTRGDVNNVTTSARDVQQLKKVESTEPSLVAPNSHTNPSIDAKKVIIVAKATKKAMHKAEKKAKKELKKAQKITLMTTTPANSNKVKSDKGEPNDKAIDNERNEKNQTPHTHDTGVAEKLDPANIEGNEVWDGDTTLGSNHVDEATAHREVNLTPVGLLAGVHTVCGDAPEIDAPFGEAPVDNAAVADPSVVGDAVVTDSPVVGDAPIGDAAVLDSPVVDAPIRDGPVPNAASVIDVVMVDVAVPVRNGPVPDAATDVVEVYEDPVVVPTATGNALALNPLPITELAKPILAKKGGQHKKKKRTKTPGIKWDAAPRVVKFIGRNEVKEDNQYQLMIRLQEVGTHGNMISYSLYYHPLNPTTVFKLME